MLSMLLYGLSLMLSQRILSVNSQLAGVKVQMLAVHFVAEASNLVQLQKLKLDAFDLCGRRKFRSRLGMALPL